MATDLISQQDTQDGQYLLKHVHPAKAMKVLGRDYSKEKVMQTLGIDPNELQLVDQELFERAEEEYKRKRETEPWRNKRNTSKAIEVLGYDPSVHKIMDTLGMDEEDFAEAQLEAFEREESIYRRKGKHYASHDKKHSYKALELLGYDPSAEKVKFTLGLAASDVDRINQEKIETYEESCKRHRRNSWTNKKESSKAHKILGIDPSKKKVADRLGLEIDELKQVELALQEQTEFRMKRFHQKDDRINKKNITKALKVLGHDPSDNKLQQHFGIERDVLLEEKHHHSSPYFNNGSDSDIHSNSDINASDDQQHLSFSPSALMQDHFWVISSTGIVAASLILYSLFKPL